MKQPFTPQGAKEAKAEIVPTKNAKKQTKELVTMADSALFMPTAPQQKVKVAFWARWRPSEFSADVHVSMALVQKVTKSAAVAKWWQVPGFKEWFNNKDIERENIKSSFNIALDVIVRDVLMNPEAQASAKVNAFKIFAEMSGHIGNKNAQKFADQDIDKMSEQQLEEFLSRKGVKVVEEQIIEIEENPKATS